MKVNHSHSISIIGPGAVGGALADALLTGGYDLLSVFSRSENPKIPVGQSESAEPSSVMQTESDMQTESESNESAEPKPSLSYPLYPLLAIEHSPLGRIIFITTPDDEITSVAEYLAESEIDFEDRVVVHCSGFLTSEELKSVEEKGACTASFHPLQTFTRNAAGKAFEGIHVSVEGDPKAADLLVKVAEQIGAQPIELDRDQKSLLHVSAVFISNYLVTLASVSEGLIRSSIPSGDLQLLFPLLRKTVRNLQEVRPEQALTGPVSRGDSRTIRKHLERLKENPNVLELYKQLGKHTLRLANHSDRLSEDSKRELKRLLREGPAGLE